MLIVCVSECLRMLCISVYIEKSVSPALTPYQAFAAAFLKAKLDTC